MKPGSIVAIWVDHVNNTGHGQWSLGEGFSKDR